MAAPRGVRREPAQRAEKLADDPDKLARVTKSTEQTVATCRRAAAEARAAGQGSTGSASSKIAPASSAL